MSDQDSRDNTSGTTPGGRIRAAREGRQMSLADLAERTKIPVTVLQAIERDEFHKVSGALYIKSFLRTCAAEVGLEADEVLELYAAYAGESTAPGDSANMVWEADEVRISRLGVPWRAIVLIGLGLVVVGAAGIFFLRGGEQPVERPAAADGINKALARPLLETPVAAIATPGDSVVAPPDSTLGGSTATPVEPGRLPAPAVGRPDMVFAGGVSRAVVLRVICDRPLAVEVKCDNEASFQSALWPVAGADAEPLPATGIRPGRVYAASRGLVMYWGADDHFSLRLGRSDGVEVSVNGQVRSVRGLRPGGELLLDDHED